MRARSVTVRGEVLACSDVVMRAATRRLSFHISIDDRLNADL